MTYLWWIINQIRKRLIKSNSLASLSIHSNGSLIRRISFTQLYIQITAMGMDSTIIGTSGFVPGCKAISVNEDTTVVAINCCLLILKVFFPFYDCTMCRWHFWIWHFTTQDIIDQLFYLGSDMSSTWHQGSHDRCLNCQFYTDSINDRSSFFTRKAQLSWHNVIFSNILDNNSLHMFKKAPDSMED